MRLTLPAISLSMARAGTRTPWKNEGNSAYGFMNWITLLLVALLHTLALANPRTLHAFDENCEKNLKEASTLVGQHGIPERWIWKQMCAGEIADLSQMAHFLTPWDCQI